MTFADVLQAISTLFRWWVCVSPWESGLRIRAGKHVTTLRPGIWLVIPYVDAIYLQSMRLRYEVMPMQTVTTKDGRPVTVGGTLGYTIADLRKVYDTLEHASATVVSMAAIALSNEVSSMTMAELTASTLSTRATTALAIDAYGFKDGQIVVTDLVSVRTYRLISDPRWSNSGSIDMGPKR